MTLIDWLIVIIPVAMVIGLGYYMHRYVRSVADFLSAGRVCTRYVVCASDVANALAVIGLVGYAESQYKCGFALSFWMTLALPVTMIMSLTGFCLYRFRETRAMSMGQFLEMRYNRSLRIFAAVLRCLCEVLCNAIMPAVAARFFIYYLGLPHSVNIGGFEVSTMFLVIVFCLTIAISIICAGGTLSMVVTDALQGIFMFPIIAVFIFFILYKFSWSEEIVPVMMDRVQGESFINPYDISKLRDFNLFAVMILIFNRIFHRASWYGAGVYSAAKNPHEQKMAGVLGAWREHITTVLHVLVALTLIVLLNHRNFAPQAHEIRTEISRQAAAELIPDEKARTSFNQAIAAVPVQEHKIGVDQPLSEKRNLDTPMLETAHRELVKSHGEAEGNALYLQYRTLFHQEMLAVSMQKILPGGMLGLFLLLMILAMISTDNTRIFSSAVTFSQDVLLPLRKKPLSFKQHLWMLRLVSIAIGGIYVIGSMYLAQMDYIQLFVMIATSIWLGGCAPVMIFGLYSRFGTSAGAFSSLISGMVLSLAAIFAQRNWADNIYPYLLEKGWVEPLDEFLRTISQPFAPYVQWSMDPVKFPINSYEIFFLISLFTLLLYCVVSYLTIREPFNLDRMLHRGQYSVDEEKKADLKSQFSWRNISGVLLGITSDYSCGDKFIAWILFIQSFVWSFLITFAGVVVWNIFSPWPLAWWGDYFFITIIAVPLVFSIISVFWFGIGGVLGLRQLFRDLQTREINPLDNGQVEGNVSLADKAKFAIIEENSNK